MKLLYSYFYPQTGESVSVLSNKNGTYTGSAKLHPDDQNVASQYAGCRLAEYRAWIKYLKSERRNNKIKLDTIKQLNKEINLYCPDINQKIQRRINLKIRDYYNNIQEINDEIQQLQTKIKKDIETRDLILKRAKIIKNNN